MSVSQLNALPPGKTLNLGRVSGSGSLEARRESTGRVQFFWRYTYQGKARRAPIGYFDPKAHHLTTEPTEAGFSIQAATREAESMAKQHEANLDFGGWPALAKINAAANRQVMAEAPVFAGAEWSLAQLCDDYVQLLIDRKKDAAGEARSCFKLHVKLAFPELANKPANQIEDVDVGLMMRTLYKAGKQRHCNKLRAYLHAAYEVARTARTAAKTPEKFINYKVRNNPAAQTKPEETDSGGVDKNPLTQFELREYWRLIKKVPGRQGLILRLHLLTGGQRIAQLARLKTADIKTDYFELLDGKGKPGKPARRHAVPITPTVRDILVDLANLNSLDYRGRTVRKPTREFALSSNGGKKPIVSDTISGWAIDLMAGHVRDFELKRVRSTIETLLGETLKISKDIRGQLQSHGIAGVQSRHYDAGMYLEDKLDALQKLEDWLNKEDAK